MSGSEPPQSPRTEVHRRARTFWHPDLVDRVLAGATLVMLFAVSAAVVRGYPHWDRVAPALWLHLAAVLVVLALTPPILLRRRGDRLHRWLGYGWVTGMAGTALLSLAIRMIRPGHLSLAHLLSIYVLVQLPLLVRAARIGAVTSHRRAIRTLVSGCLLLAGCFMFLRSDTLGVWLFRD